MRYAAEKNTTGNGGSGLFRPLVQPFQLKPRFRDPTGGINDVIDIIRLSASNDISRPEVLNSLGGLISHIPLYAPELLDCTARLAVYCLRLS